MSADYPLSHLVHRPEGSISFSLGFEIESHSSTFTKMASDAFGDSCVIKNHFDVRSENLATSKKRIKRLRKLAKQARKKSKK